MLIDVRKIAPNPQQPRTRFRQDELDELARSMQSTGLIQPIVVEAGTAGGFTLVDGERRWRAASQLGWEEIDAVIREPSKNEIERLVSAFVANEQRADMNPMERCKAYREMLQAMGTVQEVARVTGKSTSTIYSYMGLLELEPAVQKYFERGALTLSPAVLAALKRLGPEKQVQAAAIAATRGASESNFLRICERYSQPTLKRTTRLPEPEPKAVAPGAHFDALNLVKNFVPEAVIRPARETCASCELYDMASATTCRLCPLVNFLRRL